MSDLTPVEELRAAATLLRETASGATSGPWDSSDDDLLWIGGNVWGYSIPKDGTFIDGDPAWIALMSPQVAEPLAAWLEGIADEAEAHAAEGWGNDQQEITDGHPITLARTILGRAS